MASQTNKLQLRDLFVTPNKIYVGDKQNQGSTKHQ
jgi:hypothetical protein